MKKEFCDLCGKEIHQVFPIHLYGDMAGKIPTLGALASKMPHPSMDYDACAECNAKAWTGIKKVFEDLKPQTGGLPS